MPWRNVLILLALLSLYQYFVDGEITWHTSVIGQFTDSVGDYATRPDAGWRKATDQLEKVGEWKEGKPVPEFDLSGRVVGVLDGDSIIVLDNSSQEHTIRLFGIDTPEKGQPHGNAARGALSKMLARQSVGLVVQGKDQYGRLTATVYLQQDNINLAMVEAGHAWWYSRYAPHDRLLEAAQRQAKSKSIGLWADPAPVPPWEWRRQARAGR